MGESLPWDVARGNGDNVDTNLEELLPAKIWEGKNVQNLT